MSEESDRMDKAIQQALASRGGSLMVIASRYYSNLSASGYLKVCPFCEAKGQTFGVKKAAGGHWYWGCHKPTCTVNFDKLKSDRQADTIGFLMNHQGCDRKTAVDLLLDMTGTPNPKLEREQDQAKAQKKSKAKPHPGAKERKKEEPPFAEVIEEAAAREPAAPAPQVEAPAEPSPQPGTAGDAPDEDFSLQSISESKEEERITVWHDIWERLLISPSDTEGLKRKRGFNNETIQRAGLKSSTKENRTLLQPIIANYEPGTLLAEGIISKGENDEFKINRQLYGWGLKKRGSRTEDEAWDWTNPILIPYFDSKGQVIWIRPHKGGLSGKQFMRENGYEMAFRSTRTRTKPYVNRSLWQPRPAGWERRCVLTEGEFKAMALDQVGIPAIAVPGIQMPRNEIFLQELAELLREAGIREIIVVFDNEDKSAKPDPWQRYEAEIYALYACYALRGESFMTFHATLPDEWQVDGKADWDGALLKFGKSAKSEFLSVLKKAKPFYQQTELFGTNERDRVIHCKFNRLVFKPQILTGGDEEDELAKLILKTPKNDKHWRQKLRVRDAAQELFDTRGCYYVRKKLPVKDLKPYFEIQQEIVDELRSCPRDELDEIAGLEAALAAVKHTIEGRPEILSDFTVSCDFQVKTADGDVQKLFRFRNKHGQISDYVTVPSSAISGAQKFREFAMKIGNFNPIMGDKHLQQLMIDLGIFSAWREIRELPMIGRDLESGLYIYGDCAFTPGDKNGENVQVLFADGHDIIWHDGIGYRISQSDLRSFAHHEPPKFFQKIGMEPTEVLAEIVKDPKREEIEVAKIFLQAATDFICTFGDASGLLAMGTMLGYAMAPELLEKYHGHPGLWIHGRAFAGKSETSRFLMQMWGFPPEYRTFMLSGGTTAVAIDRVLAQYSDIPMHLDEFRADEADKNRISSLRGPFNRQAKQKGTMNASNKTRAVVPMTSPIVTGEGVTNDSATLSRYVEVILAKDRRIGTEPEQRARYQRMLNESAQYHRIIRWIMMRRKWFGNLAMDKLEQFLNDPLVAEKITSDRMRISYGAGYSAFSVLLDYFTDILSSAIEAGTLGDRTMSKKDLILLKENGENLYDFTLNYANKAAADVASINFVVKFWDAVMRLYNRDNQARKFIWFERCTINENNEVTVTNATTNAAHLINCVIVQSGEIYAMYEEDCAKRRVMPELSLSNIRSNLQTERYWVPAPKNKANRSHRMTIGDGGQKSVWVLRCDLMDPSLASIFSDQFAGKHDDQDDITF